MLRYKLIPGLMVLVVVGYPIWHKYNLDFINSYKYLAGWILVFVAVVGWGCVVFVGDTDRADGTLSREHLLYLLRLRRLGLTLVTVPFIVTLLMWLKVI